MKDPSEEIVDAIVTLLDGNLTYNSVNYPVLTDPPDNRVPRYVGIENLILRNSVTKDKSITDANLELQVVTLGQSRKTGWGSAAGISDSIFRLLVGVAFTMTNFTISVKPYLDATYKFREKVSAGTRHIKVLRFSFTVQEN